MPAPTNTSFLAATELMLEPIGSTLTVTQDADFGGTTYDLYFALTAPSDCAGISVFASGIDLAAYAPTTRIYVGPATAPVQIVSASFPDPFNAPLQAPIAPGLVYLIVVSTSAGNPTPAPLTLKVTILPNSSIRPGDIIIPDDTYGFGCVVCDPDTDYVLRRYVHPFSASEFGDVLHTSGRSVMLASPTQAFGPNLDYVVLYDNDLSIIQEMLVPGIININPVLKSNQTTQRVWMGVVTDPAAPGQHVRYIDVDGNFGPQEILTGFDEFGFSAVATSPDESRLYWIEGNDSLVHEWNMITHADLGTLVARDATHRVRDIIVLADGSFLIGLYKSTATKDFNVKHYSAAGGLLHTHNFGSDVGNTTPRLAHSLDNATTYWLYRNYDSTGHLVSGQVAQVAQIQVSDGSVLVNRTYALFTKGDLDSSDTLGTLTPVALMGISSSCPFWIAGGAEVLDSPNPNAPTWKLIGANLTYQRLRGLRRSDP